MRNLKMMSAAFALPMMMALAQGASAQNAATPGLKRPVEAADRGEEGNVVAREAYFRMRRLGPNANFDASAARARAVEQRIAALPQAMAQLPKAYQHAEVWEAVGPAPLIGGQTPTSPWIASPVSGRVSAIAIDPIDDVVYAGGAQGGVWRTSNGGTTWQPLTDNLGSLAVGSIAIAPGPHARNQAKVFLGTGEGNLSCDSYAGVGIYRSDDSGHSWSGPYGGPQFTGRSVVTIAIDSTNANNIVVGTTSGYDSLACNLIAGPTRTIYRSTDGGLTFTQATLPGGGTHRVSKIIQDPNVPSRFWAAMTPLSTAEHGLLRSDDSGATWTAVDGIAPGLPVVNPGLTYDGYGRSYITAAPGVALDGKGGTFSVLYYGTAVISDAQLAGAQQAGILYKSVDGGTSWSALPNADGFCQTQCSYDMPILVDPSNASTVWTGGGGASSTDDNTNDGVELTPSQFMRSVDGGVTFTSQVRSADKKTALHADMHAIVAYPGHPNEIWAANDGGIWKSTDGGTNWKNLNTTLQITQFEGCDLDPFDKARAYGGTQDNGTNGWAGGIGWPHLDFGDGGFALIDQVQPNNLVHTYFNLKSYQTGVGYTTNGFATLQGNYPYSVADPSAQGNGIGYDDPVLFYAPLHLDRGVHDTLYFGTNKLYKADTFFSFPTQTPNIFSALGTGGGQDLAPGAADFDGISAIDTVPNSAPGLDAQTLITGSSNGHVFLSNDAGVSFTEVDATPTPIAQYVSDVLFDPRNPQVVFQSRAGFTGSLPAHNVRKSNDGGMTWADSSNGLPDVPVNAIAFDPVAPNTVWAGTDIGVYLSSDGGATWNPYSNGLPNVAVFDLKANSHSQTILACTHGRGAFRLSLDAIFIDGFDGN